MVSPFVKQSWAVSAVLLNNIANGMLLSYPSCLLPALQAPDSPIPIDLNTASWLVSSVGAGSIPGIFLSTYLMDAFGRKVANLVSILPGILGWICVCFATNVSTILFGRTLSAVSAGGTVGLGAVIIGEYSSPGHRGMFLNLKTASVSLGSMVIHILGSFLHWKTVAWICIVPIVLALIITLTWAESPAWLAYKKDFDKCKKAFIAIRGKDQTSIKELDDMISAQMNTKVEDRTIKQKMIEVFKKFTKKDFIKPCIIILFGGILLEVCGRHIFPTFALKIVGEVTGSKTQSFYCTLGLDIIITLSATFSSLLVRLMKRRTLLFSTGWVGVIILAILSLYLFFVSRDVISRDYVWIPMSLLVVYFILVNLGCTPIPLALLGEVYPLAHRATGTAVAIIILNVLLSIFLQATTYLLALLKVHGTFTVFSICTAISLGVLYFILPETKDRTLQEIEDYFNYGYYKKDNGMQDSDEELKMIKKEEASIIIP